MRVVSVVWGVLLLCGAVNAQTPGSNAPYYEYAAHGFGNLQVTATNWGQFGRIPDGGYFDPFTGERVWGIIYPRNSGFQFYPIDLAIGAIVGIDTLVSDHTEMHPDIYPFGAFRKASISPALPVFDEDAYSELDLLCTYYDTLTDPNFSPIDAWEKRPHKPLGIRIDQRSMTWSSPNLDDFVLVHYRVTNIGHNDLEKLFVRIRGRTVIDDLNDSQVRIGGVTGFLSSWPSNEGCGAMDHVGAAYASFCNGRPSLDNRPDLFFDEHSNLSALGFGFLGLPRSAYLMNYNWSFAMNGGLRPSDSWGPRLSALPIRQVNIGLGEPVGDRNNYYVMSHPEFDYNQMLTHIDHTAEGWLPPPEDAWYFLTGSPVHYELSVGPSGLEPGEQIEFSIAIVGGDSVHTDPTNLGDFFDEEYPDVSGYYADLDFSSLAENMRWARKVYDNPGVDTDGDGYAGEFILCEGDTVWYRGDGVPDFQADTPPPTPITRVVPSETKLVVRWNGYDSESYVDPFTRLVDFEGYRVYVGLDSRESSMSLLSSFDNENYDRYILTLSEDSTYHWKMREPPYTLDSLRVLYDDPEFQPLIHTRVNPLSYSDTLYFFTKHDFNMFDLGNSGEIHKAYPEAPYPGTEPDSWSEADITNEHGRSLPRYWEYEYVYDKLLSTIPYFVAVTAFDYGGGGNLPPKESGIPGNTITAYAQMSSDSVSEYNLDAYVYPNPWRSDEKYRERGYENRDQSQINNRSRRIHFANLPAKCKISIFSVDGDLVREIDHDFPSDSPEAMHDEWDMVTRNHMLTQSGMYYYAIESATRTQIGTFVIIM